MSIKERPVIALLPIDAEVPGGIGVAAIIDATCGHQAYIGTASQTLLGLHPEYRTICLRCVPALVTNRRVVPGLPPGAEKELQATVGVAESDQLMAVARELGLREFPA